VRCDTGVGGVGEAVRGWRRKVDTPLAEDALAAGNEPAADTVAQTEAQFEGPDGEDQLPLDVEGTVHRGDPAADGGAGEIIPRRSAGGGDFGDAGLRIDSSGGVLPGLACEEGEWPEAGDLAGLRVEARRTVTPCALTGLAL